MDALINQSVSYIRRFFTVKTSQDKLRIKRFFLYTFTGGYLALHAYMRSHPYLEYREAEIHSEKLLFDRQLEDKRQEWSN